MVVLLSRNDIVSLCQSRIAPKAPIILLSKSNLSGPNDGNTNASTGSVVSPKVNMKRMYPVIDKGEPSALRRLMAPGGTGRML